MSDYVKAANYDDAEFQEYLEDMSDPNAGIYLSGDSPDNVIVECSGFGEYAPIIRLEPELDSDGETDRIYFMPIVELPVLNSKELDYADSVHYYLKEYANKVGRWVEQMIAKPYHIHMYYGYDDEE